MNNPTGHLLITRDNVFKVIAISSILAPYIAIILAVIRAPWFSIWSNALSDLGEMEHICSAPIFNSGLALGGYLLGLATALSQGIRAVNRLILCIAGFTLILIGVLNESYGYIHFIVSVAFFLAIIAYLTSYGYIHVSLPAFIIAIIDVIIWMLHFAYHLPPGAAIPEILSSISFIPFFLRETMKTEK